MQKVPRRWASPRAMARARSCTESVGRLLRCRGRCRCGPSAAQRTLESSGVARRGSRDLHELVAACLEVRTGNLSIGRDREMPEILAVFVLHVDQNRTIGRNVEHGATSAGAKRVEDCLRDARGADHRTNRNELTIAQLHAKSSQRSPESEPSELF